MSDDAGERLATGPGRAEAARVGMNFLEGTMTEAQTSESMSPQLHILLKGDRAQARASARAARARRCELVSSNNKQTNKIKQTRLRVPLC